MMSFLASQNHNSFFNLNRFISAKATLMENILNLLNWNEKKNYSTFFERRERPNNVCKKKKELVPICNEVMKYKLSFFVLFCCIPPNVRNVVIIFAAAAGFSNRQRTDQCTESESNKEKKKEDESRSTTHFIVGFFFFLIVGSMPKL